MHVVGGMKHREHFSVSSKSLRDTDPIHNPTGRNGRILTRFIFIRFQDAGEGRN